MKHLIILISLFVVLPCFSQKDSEVEAVFKKLKEKYGSSNQYAFSMSYRLYKGHDSGKLSEHYSAQLFHSRIGTYQKIKNTEFISSSDFSIKINHDEKAMAIADGSEFRFFEQYNVALKSSSSYNLSEKDKQLIINIYFFGPTNLPYYKMSLILEKSSYDLQEVNLYYSSQVDFNPSFKVSEFAKPHLRIKYKKTDAGQLNKNWFVKSNYYQIKSGEVVPNSKFNKYEIINKLQ